MKICILQPERTPGRVEKDFSGALALLEQCRKADWFMLPCMTPAPDEEQWKEWMSAAENARGLLPACGEAARRLGAKAVLNLAYDRGRGLRDSAFLLDERGETAFVYDKQHLTELETYLYPQYSRYITRDNPACVVVLDGLRVGFAAEGDLRFLEHIDHLAKRRVDVIFVPASGAVDGELMIRLKQCALHTNAFVVCAGAPGAAVIAPDGESVQPAEAGAGMCSFVFEPRWKRTMTDCFGQTVLEDPWMESGKTPWAYQEPGALGVPDDRRKGYPRACAAGGLPGLMPAYTLAAFGAAQALAADELAFGLWQTADGVPVAASLDDPRVPGEDRLIGEVTLQELKEIDLGARCSAQLAGLRIPTLEEVLQAFAKRVVLNIHLPLAPGAAFFKSAALEPAVQLFGRYHCDRYVYFSGGLSAMRAAVKTAPQITRCFLPEEGDSEALTNAQIYQCKKMRVPRDCTPELVEKAHRKHIRCVSCLTDDPTEVKRLINLGVDTIVTGELLQLNGALGR
jgi:glycerophosphoryl diester phosphodiesterase